jgi:bifunctional non-homologous end joining protein LigD
VHEIKHDGYRLIVRRDGEVVRLFTRRGYDWTDRYPAIAAAAAKPKARSFTLDGEAVVDGAAM